MKIKNEVSRIQNLVTVNDREIMVFFFQKFTQVQYRFQSVGMLESDTKKFDAFHKRCLRKICSIFWPEVISNKELAKKPVPAV